MGKLVSIPNFKKGGAFSTDVINQANVSERLTSEYPDHMYPRYSVETAHQLVRSLGQNFRNLTRTTVFFKEIN